MAGVYTGLPHNLLDSIETEAGVLLSEFELSTGTLDRSKIIGATTGGIQITDTPTITDFGEDIDNVPGQIMQLQRLTSRTITLASTFVSINETTLDYMIPANQKIETLYGTVTHYRPNDILRMTHFKDIWWVGNYSRYNDFGEDAGWMAIHLKNSLSTGGFALTTSKASKGTVAFTLTAYYDGDQLETRDKMDVPYDVYLKSGRASTTTSSLSLEDVG